MRNNWDFILYDVEGDKILNVVFYNSFVDTSKDFLLTKDESNYDFEKMKVLAETIRNNYDSYRDRELSE